MRSVFTITINDLVTEQQERVDYYRKQLADKRSAGEQNLDYIIRKINLADRTRQLLLRFKKDNQVNLFDYNAELNHR